MMYFLNEDEVKQFKILFEDDTHIKYEVPQNHPTDAGMVTYLKSAKEYKWLKFGYRHNLIGPAVESANDGAFYRMGKIYRKNGPAVYHVDLNSPEKSNYQWFYDNMFLPCNKIEKWYIKNGVDIIPDLDEVDKNLYKIAFPNKKMWFFDS